MTDLAILDPAPTRPLWLMTLADLALLLLGFMVLMQSLTPQHDAALAQSLRQRFAASPQPLPMPVASAAVLDFAPGSATLPATAAPLTEWARAATRDPRVSLTMSGSTDGSATDVDAATRSAPLLAIDRARAIGAMLVAAHAVAPDRITVTTQPGTRRRAVTVTLAFTGAPKP